MSIPPDFKRLDQSFIDYTQSMVERAKYPEGSLHREALSLYRAGILLDALEAAYAHIDELESLHKETKDLLVPNVYKHGEAILLLQKIKEIHKA